MKDWSSMLEEKLTLRLSEEEKDSLVRDRPRTEGMVLTEEPAQSGIWAHGLALCEEPSDV